MTDDLIPPPGQLYKYRSLLNDEDRERLWAILENRAIWLSKPSELSDPFDCRPALRTASPVEVIGVARQMGIVKQWKKQGMRPRDARLAYKRRMTSSAPHGRLILRAHDRHGIFCMSDSWEIGPMWTHYAGNGQGVCLEFDSTNPEMPFGQTQKVTYRGERPAVKPIAAYRKENQPDYIRDSFLTKSVDWQHEREWRFVKPRQVGELSFRPSLLTAIYVGDAVLKTDQHRIFEAAASKAPVRVFVVQPSAHSYGFDRVEIRRPGGRN